MKTLPIPITIHSIYIYPQTNLKKNSMMVIFYCDRGLTANHLLLIFFMTLYFHYCLTLTSALGSLIWLQVTKCAALLTYISAYIPVHIILYHTYTFICHLFVYQLRPIQIDTPLCNNGKLSPLGTIKLVLAAPLVKE